ncbi:hypothetical protein ACLOJK_025416 [Asimina triloba]
MAEKGSWFFIPKADHDRISADWDNKELFKWLYDIEARALKILEDMLLVELMVIHENATLGFKPEFDIEDRDPTKLKLWELEGAQGPRGRKYIIMMGASSGQSIVIMYSEREPSSKLVVAMPKMRHSRRGLEMELAKACEIRDAMIAEVAKEKRVGPRGNSLNTGGKDSNDERRVALREKLSAARAKQARLEGQLHTLEEKTILDLGAAKDKAKTFQSKVADLDAKLQRTSRAKVVGNPRGESSRSASNDVWDLRPAAGTAAGGATVAGRRHRDNARPATGSHNPQAV